MLSAMSDQFVRGHMFVTGTQIDEDAGGLAPLVVRPGHTRGIGQRRHDRNESAKADFVNGRFASLCQKHALYEEA